MTKKTKLLILFICAAFVLSLCAIPAFADELPDPDIVSFTVYNAPTAKTQYTAGEYFNSRGYIGQVVYKDGSTKTISSDEMTYRETAPLYGNTYITFDYRGHFCQVPVTVTGGYVPSIEISSVSLQISKTEFLELESIDPALVNVTVVCADGSSASLNKDQCIFYPELGTALGTGVTSLSVTYNYGGTVYSDSVNINVRPILSMEVSGTDNSSLYELNPVKLPDGAVVTAYYDEAKTVSQVLSNYDISSDTEFVKANENGKALLTITAGTVSVNVEVPVISVVSYKINGLKDVYYYGDIFDISAVTVQAVYSDMTSVDVTSKVTFNAPTVVKAGSTFTASHDGFDLKDFIKTEFPVGTLDIITPPAKLHYEIGEFFDKTGLAVGINYSNGERRLLNPGDYTITVSAPLTSADKFAKLEYFGATSNITFTVGNEAHIVSLNIIGMPNTMNYFEGNLISTSGLIIEAYLSDGTKSIVDPHTLTFSPSLQTPLEVGTTLITISANDGTDQYCFTTLPITVQEKLPTALVATSKPAKLIYTEGEIFDPDGLALSLIFNDLTSITPSSFTFSPALGTPIILEKSAETKLIFYAVYEYESVEYTYPIEITVYPVEIENLVVTRPPIKAEYEIGETFEPMGLELFLIYKNTALSPHVVPEGYYTFSPSVITADTKEIVFEFRGLTVSFPIKVNGGETTDVTTGPDTDITTGPDTDVPTGPNTDITTAPTTDVTTGPDSSDTDVITDPPTTTEDDITTEDIPATPGSTDITTSPDDPSTSSESTTDPGSSGGTSSLLGLWIAIIVIIIAALVALIIYYKRNFT